MPRKIKTKKASRKVVMQALKKQMLPQQQKMNELEAYWRKAKFNDDVSGVHRICLQCKRGNAKKITDCSANWCNFHGDRFKFGDMSTTASSDESNDTSARLSVQDIELASTTGSGHLAGD